MLCLALLLIISLSTRVVSQSQCAADGSSASYSEIINNNNNVRRITSRGCPNHPHPPINVARPANIENIIFRIPTYPCMSDQEPYDLSRTTGIIGITLNGISIFSSYAGPIGERAGITDAVQAEKINFDGCGGHPSERGTYHHHLSPCCLLKQLNDGDEINNYYHGVNEKHSPQIGWAIDGFPIYGAHGTNGYYTLRCDHPNNINSECLDSCNGHIHDLGVNFGILYHYHITGPIGDLSAGPDRITNVPTEDMFPYTIGCLVGVPKAWGLINGGAQQENPGQCSSVSAYTTDYNPTVTVGVTDQYHPNEWCFNLGSSCTFDGQCCSGKCNKNTKICRINNNAQQNDEETLDGDHKKLITNNDVVIKENVIALLIFIAVLFICLLIMIFMCIRRRIQRQNTMTEIKTDDPGTTEQDIADDVEQVEIEDVEIELFQTQITR